MGDIVSLGNYVNAQVKDEAGIVQFLRNMADESVEDELKYDNCLVVFLNTHGGVEIYAARKIRRDQAIGVLEMAKFKTMTQDPDE